MALFGRNKSLTPAPPAEPETPAAPAAPAEPAPAYVTRADLDTAIANGLERVLGMLQPGNPIAPAAPVVVNDDPDMPDDELDQAILSGPGAASKIKALVDKKINKAVDRAIAEHVAPLQDVGLGALGSLTAQQAEVAFPHYKRYRKEIDERVKALTPAQRVDIRALRAVHDMVVGENMDTIVQEAIEQETRRRADEANGHVSGGAPGSGGSRGALPKGSVEDAFAAYVGPDGMKALKDKNMSPDDYAQRLGYKNAAHYMQHVADTAN